MSAPDFSSHLLRSFLWLSLLLYVSLLLIVIYTYTDTVFVFSTFSQGCDQEKHDAEIAMCMCCCSSTDTPKAHRSILEGRNRRNTLTIYSNVQLCCAVFWRCSSTQVDRDPPQRSRTPVPTTAISVNTDTHAATDVEETFANKTDEIVNKTIIISINIIMNVSISNCNNNHTRKKAQRQRETLEVAEIDRETDRRTDRCTDRRDSPRCFRSLSPHSLHTHHHHHT